MKIVKFFQGRLGILKFTLLGGIIGFSFMMSAPISKLTNLSIVGEGVLTCFSRIHQSYTAKLLMNGNSNYLTPSFIASSEECLSEVIYLADTGLKRAGNDIYKGLNHLVSNVHWFHQKLNAKTSTLTEGSSTAPKLNAKFLELEEQMGVLIDNLSSAKEKVTANQEEVKNYFYISSLILLLMMVIEYFYRLRVRVKARYIELRASELLKTRESLPIASVEKVVMDGLKLAGLSECSEVFSKFNDDLLSGKFNLLAPKEYVEDEVSAIKVKEVLEVQEEEIVEDVVENRDDLVGTKLDHALGKIIDGLSSKLFTNGIVLDLNVDQDLMLLGERESIEHVFFHSLVGLVDICKDMSSSRKITINARSSKKQVVVDFICSGVNAHFDENRSVDLTICKELMGEYLGSCKASSVEGGEECLSGYRIEYKFKTGTSNNLFKKSKRLTKFRKGKKKDLIRENSI